MHHRTSHTVAPRWASPWALVLPWLALLLCAPASAQSIKRGQVLFETHCVTCHALDTNRAGPALRGVVGRPAGKAPEFFYSEALESANHVWDKTKLKAWLTNPESVVPGQEMNFHLDAARDREDVVAYLASLPKRSPTQH
ncbi:MAG: cytochrome C [Burkholderiales bacterium PBB3]|nr:MAG: cytochrome C [Burkholderiales bacterium PBB3]